MVIKLPNPIEIAQSIVDIAADKQASDIVLFDITALTTIADFFVIMSVDNNRQLDSIQKEITDDLKHQGIASRKREGGVDSGWVLIDCGDVIIHLFGAAERQYYQLDEVWNRAPVLIRIQ